MKILAAGGGSGGHVIPVAAVFKELFKKSKSIEIRFWCDKKFKPQAEKIMQNEFRGEVKVESIISGKLRRYNHLTFLQHFTVPSVLFGNFIDLFKNIAGLAQSFVKLIFWRPDVIFCKGGFVCVPIGVAAWILRIPIVIHDSDAHPGLANRILSKFAKRIATGAPLEYYNYPKNISTYIGIPVMSEYKNYTKKQRNKFKLELGFKDDKPLVVITGGGLGAARINNATVNELSALTSAAQIVLISGVSQYKELSKFNQTKNFYLYDFISNNMWKYLAAADLVVARAGATSILELAALAKPTILVPNARLTGGHQLKNAKVYEDAGAVQILSDDEIEHDTEKFSNKILTLLNDDKKMSNLGISFNEFARPNAAEEMSNIILSQIKR